MAVKLGSQSIKTFNFAVYIVFHAFLNDLYQGSPTVLGFGAKFTIHYLCLGQMEAKSYPILNNAVHLGGGGCCEEREFGRLQEV